MDLSKFTLKSQEVVQRAQQIAMSNGQQTLETSHFLKAIFDVDDHVAPYLLKKLDVPVQVFELALDKVISSYSKVSGGQLTLSSSANQMLINSLNVAEKMKDDFVS
ncbi:MAG: Clp protease N-terminal domain-containing protein, partial [Flavobacteriales bacterium]